MIQYRKLQKLANHLRRGKLGHPVFDFSCINGGVGQCEVDPKTLKVAAKPCGTNGCAMGELPIVFPKDWAYPDPDIDYTDGVLNITVAQTPEYIRGDTPRHEFSQEVANFFGISQDAVDHLFYPDAQDPRTYGGKHLKSNATRLQVAKQIEAFIVKMKSRRGEK